MLCMYVCTIRTYVVRTVQYLQSSTPNPLENRAVQKCMLLPEVLCTSVPMGEQTNKTTLIQQFLRLYVSFSFFLFLSCFCSKNGHSGDNSSKYYSGVLVRGTALIIQGGGNRTSAGRFGGSVPPRSDFTLSLPIINLRIGMSGDLSTAAGPKVSPRCRIPSKESPLGWLVGSRGSHGG